MSILTIAYNNFKNNLKVYTAFFISNIFSVFVLINFMILADGGGLTYVGNMNEENMRIMIKIIIVFLVTFLFGFIGEASKVFLKNRKKEIGIYTFMGLDSVVVGKIYFLEIMMIGISSLIVGSIVGVGLSKFFQMIVFKVAGFEVNIKFNVTFNSILYTAVVFLSIFLFMGIKGFISIIRSSVISLLNANKKAEKMMKINFVTYIIGIISLGLIIFGYYLIWINKTNCINTLVLVCIGTIGLFTSCLPVVLKFFINKKSILYKGENVITINNLAYRIKKNSIMYANMAILTAYTVTVLGISVAMKTLYNDYSLNNELYSMSFYSQSEIKNQKEINDTLSSIGDLKYEVSADALKCRRYSKDNYEGEEIPEAFYSIAISYNEFKNIVKSNGNEEVLNDLTDDLVKGNNVIYIDCAETLASMANPIKTIKLEDIEFDVSAEKMRVHIFSSGLKYRIIIVNEDNYNKLKESATPINFYGIKVNNDEKLLDKDLAQDIVSKVSKFIDINNTQGNIGILENEKVAWLKGIYAIGAFLFLVFMIAEASMIYTKVFSDANEDKEKYKILLNIGASKKDLRRSINKEVFLFYTIPVGVGLIHSYFAIHCLGDMLSVSLNTTFLVSMIVSIVIFGISAVISMGSFKKIAKV